MTTAQLIPPMTLDLGALLPPLPKAKDLWPPYPAWLADNGEKLLWRRLWTDAASSGERPRRPSEAEVEAFPEVVRLLREALAADRRMSRAAFAGNGADFLKAEVAFFAVHDALHLLVKTAGLPSRFLANILNPRVRTYPTKHIKVGESHAEYVARYNNTIAAHKSAKIPIVWAEDM